MSLLRGRCKNDLELSRSQPHADLHLLNGLLLDTVDLLETVSVIHLTEADTELVTGSIISGVTTSSHLTTVCSLLITYHPRLPAHPTYKIFFAFLDDSEQVLNLRIGAGNSEVAFTQTCLVLPMAVEEDSCTASITGLH